ncbi:MAG UNVERIFIED_CONTAM: HlyD family secretion protein [Rickettsiaceae bacterium]|jgi:HlyD family secretion protein
MTNTTSNIGNKAVPNQDAAAALKSLTQNMSQDQMQQLMAAMQKQQLQAMPKHKRLFMQAMQYLGPRLQAVVVHLDRFINFVTKPSDEDRNDVVQAARAPILFGTYVAIIFFGFGGLWTALAPLDSSSSAPGTLISSTNKKTLQFQQGGLVKAIYVKQGDRVKAGDPIVALEDTNFKANYEAILSQYRTLKAQESRLIAQKDNLPNIEFSAKLLQDAEKPEVAKILKIEKQVFEARRALVDTIEKHTMQRIDQNSKQIEGAREKKLAAKRAYEFLEERLKASKSLFAKGIISKQQLSEIETKYAEAKSNDLTIDTEIIRLEQETSRLEIELSQKE